MTGEWCYIPFSPLSISVPLLLFHSILFTFISPSPLLSVLSSLSISIHFTFCARLSVTFHFPSSYYFPFLSSYYFPFLLYFYSPFLSLVAWYWYHEHCLSSITLNHVLLTLLDNPYPYLLSIPCIIFIPLICLSISFSI